MLFPSSSVVFVVPQCPHHAFLLERPNLPHRHHNTPFPEHTVVPISCSTNTSHFAPTYPKAAARTRPTSSQLPFVPPPPATTFAYQPHLCFSSHPTLRVLPSQSSRPELQSPVVHCTVDYAPGRIQPRRTILWRLNLQCHHITHSFIIALTLPSPLLSAIRNMAQSLLDRSCLSSPQSNPASHAR